MRKILVVCLLVTLLCAVASAAMGEITCFSVQTNATSGYPTWGEPGIADDNEWYINWEAPSCNIAEYRRAVVVIMDETGDEPVSSLWVYSTLSSKKHPYKIGKITPNETKTLLSCRLDNNDGAYQPLKAAGCLFH